MDYTSSWISLERSLSPLIVALVMKETGHYSSAYALLAIPAGLAMASMFTAIKFDPDSSRFEESKTHDLAARKWPRAFWIYVIAAGLVAAGIVDYPLVAFHFHKTSLVSPAAIPVFYGIAMGMEALMAVLFGKFFDRIGSSASIVGVLLSAASTPLVFFGSMYVALAGMALWGAGMGAQQTTLRARIVELVPANRGSAYGIFNTVFGIL